jgi:hypothetical protein
MIDRQVSDGTYQDVAKSVKRLFRDIDVWGGRLLFGNTTPALNNVSGRLARMRSTRAFDRSLQESRDAQNFRRLGIVNLGYPFNRHVLAEITSKFQGAIEDDRYSFPYADRPNTVKRIANALFCRKLCNPRSISELETLITPSIIDLLEHNYGAHFGIVTVEMYRTYHVESQITAQVDPYSSWWHCDQRPTDLVKLFINLTEVDENSGPFMAATRSMTAEMLRSERFRGRHETAFDPSAKDLATGRIVALTGKPGVAMLCNTQECLHRAGVPQQGRHRDLLQIVLCSSKAPLKQGWLQAIDPQFGKASRYRRP